MRIAHLSDTHLGFTAFSRTTAKGINQREVDVMTTFKNALDAIEEADVDLVVHAGDMFHRVRPGNWTVINAFKGLSKFQERRGGRPFLVIGGNHDTPQVADSAHILSLYQSIPGVTIALDGARSEKFPDLDLEVMMVSSAAVRTRENVAWVPQTSAATRVLMLHGLASGVVPETAGEFTPEETAHARWTYVALGDFHVRKEMTPNMYYSGSTDYTTTNIWEEIPVPKGWILYDTDAGTAEIKPLKTRRALDLPTIDATGMDAKTLLEAMVAAAVWEDEEMPIVRQTARNVDTEVGRSIEMGPIREIQERALNYQYRFQPPRAVGQTRAQEVGRVASLEEEWTSHVESARIPLGLAKDDVAGQGVSILKEVAEDEATTTEA